MWGLALTGQRSAGILGIQPRPKPLPEQNTPSSAETVDTNALFSAGRLRSDIMTLTKARLSVLVTITSFVGYLVAAKRFEFDTWTMLHCILGTTLAAFAAAVFNQILEADADALMNRTADRPLPAKRMTPTAAFIIGWFLAALGLAHLLVKTNPTAAILAGATLFTYIFIYTPLKAVSSTNTLIGAVSGALPPLIGWTAGDGGLWTWEAACLFGLLFFWQLPHFIAINWMYREDYVKAGFVMWSNNDDTGRLSAWLAILFTLGLIPVFLVPLWKGFAGWTFAAGGTLLTCWILFLAWRFLTDGTKKSARRLFLATLLYLPLVLTLTALTWR